MMSTKKGVAKTTVANNNADYLTKSAAQITQGITAMYRLHSKWSQAVETVAFKNPDGNVVAVVLNRTDTDEKFAFRLKGEVIDCKAEAHSIATYIFGE